MLTYTLNNKNLVIKKNTSIRITWKNPACFFEEIPGNNAIGITIPVEENNRTILGFPERMEKLRTKNDKEFPGFEIRYNGYLLLAGTLIIQSATKNEYTGWVRSSIGDIGKKHREKFIYDIYAFSEEKTFINKSDYDPILDEYGCPEIRNSGFFKDKGKTDTFYKSIPNPEYFPGSGREETLQEPIERTIWSEAFRRTSGYTVNDKKTDNTINITPSTSSSSADENMKMRVVSPMLFLNYVLKTLYKDVGFYIENNAIADNEDLKKLIIYNNFDITNIDFNVNFGDWKTDIWNDGQHTSAISEKITEFIRNYEATFQYKNLIPKIKLKDFQLGIQNLINVFVFPKSGGKVDIIDREQILKDSSIDIEKYMIGEWQLGEKKEVTLKFSFSHDSDDNFFQERWEDIDDRRFSEKEAVNTWEELKAVNSPEIGEIRYVKKENLYAEYGWLIYETINPATEKSIQIDYLGWKHFSIGFQNAYYNKGMEKEEEISTAFSTVFGEDISEVDQKGNIKSLLFYYSSFTPRLLFYLGNNTAKYETENISLDWKKEKTGLLATRWALWSRFWSERQPVEGEANFSLNMLDFVIRNLYKKFRSREGEFIIEEIECEFSNDQIGTTTIKGYHADIFKDPYTLDSLIDPGTLVLPDEYINMDHDLDKYKDIIKL